MGVDMNNGAGGDSSYLCNLQEPLASRDAVFKRQVLYSFAHILRTVWNPKPADTLDILEDYMCSFL